jgi:glyoxylase-like metal-dependent hydrolase (beta-lactamase superfamily II)
MEAGQAVLVDTDYALDDEVWLTLPPGHTAGQVSVNIASRGRNAVITGDMMHSPIQLAHPEWSPNIDHNPLLSAETRKHFLESHCETGTLVMAAHFPSPSVGFITSHVERPFDFKYVQPH